MEIRAFRGWRYRSGADGDVSAYIAPPYDVLSAGDKEELLSRSGNNIVAVDMPHVPADSQGPDEVYQAAAARLDQWRSQGVIRQESAPAVYAYQQQYAWAGRIRRRTALICGVRATALGEDVIPHEHTFPGPKADRLRLMQCTGMQLSPVLGFYRDQSGRAGELLAEAATAPPQARGRLGDAEERLWVIRDQRVIGELADLLRNERVIIADGHHRYTTALDYRDSLADGGRLPADHEANFAMFALVAKDDPGLLILPTHRIIRDLASDFSMEALASSAKEFSWQSCEPDRSLHDADALLRPFGRGAMGFIPAGARQLWIARLTNPDAMRQVASDQVEARRRLDVAVLHNLLIENHLRPWWTERTAIGYTAALSEVLDACRPGGGALGICLQPATLQEVEDVAFAGATMPHKSTYFYPKLSTGWVLKPLT